MRWIDRIRIGSAVLLAVWLAGPSHAQVRVTVDTSGLSGTAGPWYVDFQLNDGSATGDGNSTATLDDFSFGGGAAGPDTPNLTGDAGGDLVSSVVLRDGTPGVNEFFQEFQPGVVFSFDANFSTSPEAGPIPDQFSFALLDSSLTQVPTVGPGDALLTVDLGDSGTLTQTYGTDPLRTSIQVAAPSVSPAAAVPEPSGGVLLSCGATYCMVLAAARRRRD